MKRFAAMLLAIAMLAALCACGSTAASSSVSAASSSSPSSSAGSASSSAGSASSSVDGAVSESASLGTKIGIMCSPVSFGEENYRMVEKYVAKYGEDRFIINTLPEDADVQTEITQATNIAMDPDCTVLIVDEEIGGCVAAMNAARQTNPDLLIFAVNLNEEPKEIAEVADFCCGKSMDEFMHGCVTAAKEKGCEKLNYMVPADIMGGTTQVERIDAGKKYCKENNMEFLITVLPNQQDSNARSAIEQAAKEDVLNKVDEYGDKIGFVCSCSFSYVPVLSAIVESGKGYLISTCDPGPFTPSYCDVFGIVAPDDHVLDLDWTNKAIADKCVETGNVGRIGNWKFSFLSGFMAASIDYALAYQAGDVGRDDYAAWMNFFQTDSNLSADDYSYVPFENDGVTYDNCLLVTGKIMFYGEDLGV